MQHGQAQTEGIPNAKIIAKYCKKKTALIAISCVFWIYCLVVLLVYIGTIFEIHDESINTIRVALNIENTEILDIFETMAFSRLSFLYFLRSILIQKWQRGRES
ncbi:intracellular adhesion protein IcaD [Staphylococcus aureus]